MTDNSEQTERYTLGSTVIIDGKPFEIIKDARLLDGVVLKCENVYGRLGPKELVLEEQAHTLSLHKQGFPVPKVLSSGKLPDGMHYFTESSLGKETFHELFTQEYRKDGSVSDATFNSYLTVIEKYTRAQSKDTNRTNIAASKFISSLLPDNEVLPSYVYFGYEADEYLRAITKASDRLTDAPMGILQYDLNPYNMLDGGVIDFELVGHGPIGYDTLMSVRWGGTWFTDYPSRYPISYALSPQQIASNDALISTIAAEYGLPDPSINMQEFLLLKSAWALAEPIPLQPDWPQDKLAFRKFRTNVLHKAVVSYLHGKRIHYESFSKVSGGELIN